LKSVEQYFLISYYSINQKSIEVQRKPTYRSPSQQLKSVLWMNEILKAS